MNKSLVCNDIIGEKAQNAKSKKVSQPILGLPIHHKGIGFIAKYCQLNISHKNIVLLIPVCIVIARLDSYKVCY